MKHIAIIALALLLGACVKETLKNTDSPVSPRFRTGVYTYVNAAGDSLVAGDSVGIFMIRTGGTLQLPSGNLANNVAYIAQADGSLVASETPIVYPDTGLVNFIAYAPYINPMRSPLSIDVSKDWLRARKDSLNANNAGVTLHFTHLLCKLTMNLTIEAPLVFDPAIVARLDGLPSSAQLNLNNGSLSNSVTSMITPTGISTAFDTTFTSFIVPHAPKTGRTATFEFGGKQYVWSISDGMVFNSGKHYIFDLTVKPAAASPGPVEVSSGTSVEGWNNVNNPPIELQPTPVP